MVKVILRKWEKPPMLKKCKYLKVRNPRTNEEKNYTYSAKEELAMVEKSSVDGKPFFEIINFLDKDMNIIDVDLKEVLKHKYVEKKPKEKEVKKDRKGMVGSSVTHVKDVMDVMHVTGVTYPFVTNITCNTAIWNSIFSDSTLDKIWGVLACEERCFTYGEIAKELGKEESAIKMTISRNKHYFDIKKGNDKICYVSLLHVAVDEIKQRIENYHQKIELDKELEEKAKQKEAEKTSKTEELLLESKNFYKTYKKDILVSDNVFFINFDDLQVFSIPLSDELLSNPDETLRIIETAIEEYGIMQDVVVRIKNLPDSSKIMVEDIRSKHIDRLISIKARIIQSSDARPQTVNAKFECPSCGTIISVIQMEKKFREPTKCSCGRRGGFKLMSKEMVDTARIIVQDLQESCENTSPKRLNCFVKGDLTSKEILNKMLKAGNDVIVNGVLKEVPVPLKTGGLSTRFELAMEVNYIELAEEDIDLNKLTKEEIKSFEDLAKRIDKKGIGELTPSFAPVVIGHEYEKQALILYPCNQFNRPGIDEERNKSNILFIGDTSTSKSVLVKFLESVSVGSLKVVGGSVSAVGITATTVQDDFLGGWMINPGALVLAKDMLFLEELSGLADEEKSKIIDALESQYVNVTKAGVSAVFKVRTGVVACANPILGNFQPSQNITEIVKQFNIPAQLLSRFDSIFLFRDVRDEKKDYEISLSMKKRRSKSFNPDFDKDFLKKFFYYTRNRKEPIMEEEFEILSSKIYSSMRKKNMNYLTSRTSEAMDRMCIASAKLRGSNFVEEKDLERVVTILSYSYFALPEYPHIKKDLDYGENGK